VSIISETIWKFLPFWDENQAFWDYTEQSLKPSFTCNHPSTHPPNQACQSTNNCQRKFGDISLKPNSAFEFRFDFSYLFEFSNFFYLLTNFFL
jgi:hypothetical protein